MRYAIDFTSSLYLGMKHPSRELNDWSQLTTGVPAALYESISSKKISKKIARLQGLETGILAPSTLHLFHDLYKFLSERNISLFVDDKAYPVSRYGIAILQEAKVPVFSFRHLDATHLNELVKKNLKRFQAPVVICDGWCTLCGKPSPIGSYLEIVTPFLGNIIVDDTQAIGILGKKNDASIYGLHGGGILKWLNVDSEKIIVISSLAKAFGVPMAVISGNNTFIEDFIDSSKTRVYSSPVNNASVSAAFNALSINTTCGERLREKLLANTFIIRNGLQAAGLNSTGGCFPVQSISDWPKNEVIKLFEKLNRQGIKTALINSHMNTLSLAIVIRSDNTAEELQTLLGFLCAK